MSCPYKSAPARIRRKNSPVARPLATCCCARFSPPEPAIRRGRRTPSSPRSCSFVASRSGRVCSSGRAGCRAITRRIATSSARSATGWPSYPRSRSPAPATTVPGCRPASAPGVKRPALLHGRRLVDERDNLFGKPLHLLELRAELQEQEIHARLLERANPIGDLLRCSCESRLQSAIGNRIVLQAHALLELRVGEPLFVVRISCGI